MCGIAGRVDARASAETRLRAVNAMNAAMVHRGPDDSGVWSCEEVTLGMRRLAIFDPAHGQQPIRSPDGRFTLVFNGAIYNFRALREELGSHGWPFRTHCDTEVLLAAFAHWGERCLERLRGMFAFAVWDAAKATLFLARDPFGIKPLYYCQVGPQLSFASEIRALIAGSEGGFAIDRGAVADYLSWLAVPAPRTIYQGVRSLRPGECATFRAGQLVVRRAWSFDQDARSVASPCRTRDEFSRELRARLEDSVRAHRVADVPVGAFLSGGLDSAAIVALLAQNTSGLATFSITFDEAGYSESAAAEATARHFGTSHHAHVLTGAAVARDIEHVLGALDQPSGDGLNTYYASGAARAGGVKVALSGLGGDELFGGYPSFRDVPRLARWLPWWHSLPEPLRRRITSRLDTGDTRRRKLADVLRHARTAHEVSALQRRVFSETACRALLHDEDRGGGSGLFHPELETIAAELNGSDTFKTVSAWELRTYMADVLLRDSDVMSMRHSLELRVPLVDRPLIEWLWAQPASFKADATRPKAALFDAVRDLVPAELATRRKQGFALPLALWMKKELRPFLDDVFSDRSVDQSGLFARAAVQRSWRGYIAGHDKREWSRVWSLAVLIAFANRRSAAPPVPPRAAPLNVESRGNARLPGRSLLLAPEIFASEGGIPRILQLYLRALSNFAAARDDVRLLALNDCAIGADALRRCSAENVSVAEGCARDKLRFVSAALRLSRGCERLVCGHIAQLPVAWLAKQLNPRLRYYLVAHGIEVWRSFNAAERIALRGAERVLCVSDYTRGELLKHCPLPDGRAVVLHNALDANFSFTTGRPLVACPPVILAVTRLTWDDRYKGVDHLIQALPAIRAAVPNAVLRLIGRGDDVPRLRALAAELGLLENGAVTFAGYVDDDALQEELSGCRLFALPSKKEGFGLVFLEAMASGRPCLGARAGGVPEVVGNDVGVLVAFGDVNAIAAAAIEALLRPWDEAAIVARARRFSYPAFAAQLATQLDA